jgi:hypothetical protein
MTRPRDNAAAQAARALASYDLIEKKLQEIIDTPQWPVRNGKVVLDESGQPVPKTRPARQARALLAQVRSNRERITGRPATPGQP